MTATYALGSLSTPLNKIRLALGDTNMSAPWLQDEEINAIYSLTNNVGAAIPACCEAIAGKQAGKFNTSGQGQSHSVSQIFDHWMQRATYFRNRLSITGTGAGFIGGIAGADTYQPTIFGFGMMDNQQDATPVDRETSTSDVSGG